MRIFLPKHHGVLGINARNLHYLRPFNPSKAIAFADDKLKTKVFLEARGIPVPKLYAKISTREELRAFDFTSLPESFVLKPNFGYGGEGIVVVSGRSKEGLFKVVSGTSLSYREIFEHIEDILDGMYAIHHRRDTAFFEQVVTAHDAFAPLHPAGLPDIRIVVHNLVPVMAMLRVPSAESEGKANLHRGGIGLGVDIAKGTTTFGVQYYKLIRFLPNGRECAGFTLPHWGELLLIASRIQQITNIGFMGVDLTLDAESGPMLLEVNARAGLQLQVANLAPLKKRLERVEGLKVSSPEKGVRIAQDLFGEKIETRESKRQEKPVLATRENIEILGGRKPLVVPAILRPDHDRTVFDPSLLRELESLSAVERVVGPEEKYRVKFQLGGKKLQTIVHPHPIEEEGVRASLGKRDLTHFFVDPGKSAITPSRQSSKDLYRIDKQLADMDRKLQFLSYLRPSNLEVERRNVLADPFYNPTFLYDELQFPSSEFLDRLRYLEADASPMGVLLEKKRQELMRKIELLHARGNNVLFTERSTVLYGVPTPSLVREARTELERWRKTCRERKGREREEELLGAEEVRELFQKALHRYGLRHWDVRLADAAIADCWVGRDAVYLRRDARFTPERAESLIVHEIDTHVLTRENGMRQPYELFERGCAGYLETQEGMAIYNQNQILPQDHEKRYWHVMGILAIQYGLKHSFADLRRYIRRLGFDDQFAQRTCFKVKRGLSDTSQPGAFTKEMVYFTGLKLVEEFLRSGGEISELYIGKISIRDIALVRKVPDLVAPVYLPKPQTTLE